MIACMKLAAILYDTVRAPSEFRVTDDGFFDEWQDITPGQIAWLEHLQFDWIGALS